MILDLIIQNDRGGQRFGGYEGRLSLTNVTNWLRAIPAEPILDASPTMLQIDAAPFTNSTTNQSTMGTVTGSGSYVYGSKALLVATPSSSAYAFVRWSSPGTEIDSSTNPSITIQVMQDITNIQAIFTSQ
jgi:hypothetical protein